MTLQFAKELHRLPEERRQLIFRVRRQIAEGNYDTPERFRAALEALLDQHSQLDDPSEE
ncbi:hypothetical protein [Kolteria novifilia]